MSDDHDDETSVIDNLNFETTISKTQPYSGDMSWSLIMDYIDVPQTFRNMFRDKHYNQSVCTESNV